MKKTPEKILNTAFDCLGEHGYANVSMRDIAKESNTALSQLTYHFKTKEGLFLEVINMMAARYISEVECLLKQADSAKEKLGILVKYFKDLVKNNPKLLRLFVDFTAQAMWTPSFKQKINSLFNDLAQMIETEIVAEVKEKVTIKKDAAQSTARLIFGTLYGIAVQMMLGKEQDLSTETLNLTKSLLY